MKSMFFAALIGSAILLPACSIENRDTDGEMASQQIDEELKSVEKGEFKAHKVYTAKLSPRTEVHYQLKVEGREHYQLVLKSGDFEPRLRIPSLKLDLSAKKNQNNGAWYVETPILAQRGSYEMVISARGNGGGEYTMSAEATCGGIAGFSCPDKLKCVFTGENHPDMMGSCVGAKECAVPSDCEGQSHKAGSGRWACDLSKSAFGTCRWDTAPQGCSGLGTEACQANSACEMKAHGCEKPCTTAEDGTTVCHPCDPILECAERATCGGFVGAACVAGQQCIYQNGSLGHCASTMECRTAADCKEPFPEDAAPETYWDCQVQAGYAYGTCTLCP